MRITEHQSQKLVAIAKEKLGQQTQVFLFGSRANDSATGGDVDIMIKTKETIEQPALVSAELTVAYMRLFNGRKVDVILSCPNLEHKPIHDIAEQGVRL